MGLARFNSSIMNSMIDLGFIVYDLGLSPYPTCTPSIMILKSGSFSISMQDMLHDLDDLDFWSKWSCVKSSLVITTLYSQEEVREEFNG